ncbi:MAG: transcription termination factor NusA [Bacilli bacterium]
MKPKAFLEAIDVLVKEKQIKKEVIIDAMEHAMLHAYKKNFKDTNARVDIDSTSGVIKVFSQRTVVEDGLEDIELSNQIPLSEAREINPNYSLGDIIENEVTPDDFGRLAAQSAKQVVLQKIREAERQSIFDEFSLLEGELVVGTLSREDNYSYFVDLGRSYAILPKTEIIPGEKLVMGNKIEVYLSKVDHKRDYQKEGKNQFPVLQATRISNEILMKLMEKQIPEIKDGLVEIHAAVRDAGDRSKVAVYSTDSSIDAIGSCIGPKGTRIQNIINTMNGEKIDLVVYDKDPEIFITNAVAPAKVIKTLIIDKKDKVSVVIVTDDQISIAIGKSGQNVRLAAQLTGWKIDIKTLMQAQEEGIF